MMPQLGDMTGQQCQFEFDFPIHSRRAYSGESEGLVVARAVGELFNFQSIKVDPSGGGGVFSFMLSTAATICSATIRLRYHL